MLGLISLLKAGLTCVQCQADNSSNTMETLVKQGSLSTELGISRSESMNNPAMPNYKLFTDKVSRLAFKANGSKKRLNP